MTTESLGPQKLKGRSEQVEAFKVIQMQHKLHAAQ